MDRNSLEHFLFCSCRQFCSLSERVRWTRLFFAVGRFVMFSFTWCLKFYFDVWTIENRLWDVRNLLKRKHSLDRRFAVILNRRFTAFDAPFFRRGEFILHGGSLAVLLDWNCHYRVCVRMPRWEWIELDFFDVILIKQLDWRLLMVSFNLIRQYLSSQTTWHSVNTVLISTILVLACCMIWHNKNIAVQSYWLSLGKCVITLRVPSLNLVTVDFSHREQVF